jgi:hypothetical protein
MKNLLLFLIVILAISNLALADPLTESTLKDGIGVRPMGMGGAFTALASDANSIFYNPAGLAKIGFSYFQGWQDLKCQKYQVNDYILGTFNSFGIGSWSRQDLTGSKVDVTAYSFGTADENIAWGMTYKRVIQNTSAISAEGYSIDAGFTGKFSDELFWGLLLQDIYKNIAVPASVRGGLLYYYNPTTLVVVDAELRNLRQSTGMDLDMHYGIESKVAEGLVLRAGSNKGYYTFGATATIPYFTFDYALSMSTGPNQESTHMFGLHLDEPVEAPSN